jgi:hypothetical protein
MSFDLKLPVRDESEVVSARTLAELPSHLSDPDERAIARELLSTAMIAAAPESVTVGQLVALLEEIEPSERAQWADALGRRAGLPPLAAREFEQARQHQAGPAEADQAVLVFERGQWRERLPELRLAFSPSGGIIDLDEQATEAAREQSAARSRAAQAEVRRADAEAEAAQLRAFEDALIQQWRRETPSGIPSP